MKSVSNASSTLEHKIFPKKEADENKKTTTDEDCRQNPQKFIQKLRNLTFKSTSTKSEESEPDNTLPDSPVNILVTQASISESNEEPKLKVCLIKSKYFYFIFFL